MYLALTFIEMAVLCKFSFVFCFSFFSFVVFITSQSDAMIGDEIDIVLCARKRLVFLFLAHVL